MEHLLTSYDVPVVPEMCLLQLETGGVVAPTRTVLKEKKKRFKEIS